jgi:hypothetical protein
MLRLLTLILLLQLTGRLDAQYDIAIQYFRLEGVIGKSNVVLHLHRITRADTFEPTAPPFSYYTGNYYYTKYGSPIRFDGQMDSTGMIVLSEMLGWDVTGTFRLDKNFQGVWISGDSLRTLRVALQERYPQGTTAFEGKALSDRHTLKNERGPAAEMTTTAMWLEPSESASDWAQFLQKEHIRQFIGEDTTAAAMNAAFRSAGEQSLNLFRSDMEALPAAYDSTMPEYMMRYAFEFQSEVLYNEAGLLSMGFTQYSFTGGAHGNYATTVVSYDPARKKAIELKDVLKPGYEKALQTALNQAARKRSGLSPDAGLDSTYFVEDIPVTENFYLTHKGMVFSYPPYEIASYADGQVVLFVPFSSLKTWLQPPWK